MPPVAKKPAPPRKTAKAPSKNQDRLKQALTWGGVALAVVGIIVLAMNAPREKTLSCSGSGGSLIGFGSCTAE